MKADYVSPKLTVFGNVEELTQSGGFEPADDSVFQVATYYGNPYRKYKPRRFRR